MKYKFLLSLMALFFAVNVSAQEKRDFNRAFVGVQGGVMRAYNGANVDRKWGPAAAVSFGYNFTRVFGLRLQANGSQWTAETPRATTRARWALSTSTCCSTCRTCSSPTRTTSSM